MFFVRFHLIPEKIIANRILIKNVLNKRTIREFYERLFGNFLNTPQSRVVKRSDLRLSKFRSHCLAKEPLTIAQKHLQASEIIALAAIEYLGSETKYTRQNMLSKFAI